MTRNAIITVVLSMLLSAQAATAQEVGWASFYHDYFNGKRTASGELYSSKKLTAAHRTLPIGTMIKVTNLANDRSIVVRINDRGPFVQGRILDLSRAAAEQLGYIAAGSAKVSMEVINNSVIEVQDTIHTAPLSDLMYMITEVDTCTKLQYGVKLGSFDDPKLAFTLSKELKAKYNAVAYVQNVKLVKGSLFRIYLGNFGTIEEANKLRDALKKLYPESKVVSYDGLK
ncbi:MAG: septal ring lytic transglycosylase RlpA family protein [Bacteroidetes bacterium]|nr:septal ring lytic transglycosylase RlpA family protein [Bacteroidota bacterium]MBS1684453.1 septal ring lytic transglycosylase RlpA family protein [Bacteroidota bacterium]